MWWLFLLLLLCSVCIYWCWPRQGVAGVLGEHVAFQTNTAPVWIRHSGELERCVLQQQDIVCSSLSPEWVKWCSDRGYQVKEYRSYTLLVRQPDEQKGLSFNFIVFSKNRAMQLHAFLASARQCFQYYDQLKIQVLYTHDPEYINGYTLVQQEFPEVHFVKERDFAQDLRDLVGPAAYTVFGVDDMIWINKVNLHDAALLDIDVCLSWRLHPHLDYCYTQNKKMTAPTMKAYRHYFTYDWSTGMADYGYPMSLDGHVFLTERLRPLLQGDYRHPNELEVHLNRQAWAGQIICYDHAKVFNVPVNRVQHYARNRHGTVSAYKLEQDYIKGHRINVNQWLQYKNHACHEEVVLSYEQ
jgi:hypothetical protein